MRPGERLYCRSMLNKPSCSQSIPTEEIFLQVVIYHNISDIQKQLYLDIIANDYGEFIVILCLR